LKFQELLAQFTAKKVAIVGVSTDDQATNAEFAKQQGFEFQLICDDLRSVSMAYGAAKSANATASRMAVLIDRDGNVEKVWSSVDARKFPDEALASLKEPPPPPPPYVKPGLTANADRLKPEQRLQCSSCGFKWSTLAYDKPKCPKCLAENTATAIAA